MHSDSVRFSLVIPCYNEAKNLPLLLRRISAVTAHECNEVILVDNGSTDGTDLILQELLPQYPGCRSVRVENNQGYGFGILAGLKAARGEILGWTHADLQTDPQDALVAVQLFEKYGKKSFIKGRRFGRPLADVVFTMGMSVFESILLRKLFWDINAQPVIFSRDFFVSWQDDAPFDFSLDLYCYYQARSQKLLIKRFPVKFGERAHGVSHWNINWASKLKFIRRTVGFSLELLRRNLVA
jgi:glycosyltransferase involved in cell wall biosynthesis